MWSNQVEVEAAAELEAMASAHGFQPDEPEAGLLYLCLCSIEVSKGRGWTYFFGSGVFFDAGVDVSEPYIRDFWYHVLQCLLLQDSDVQPSLLTLYFWWHSHVGGHWGWEGYTDGRGHACKGRPIIANSYKHIYVDISMDSYCWCTNSCTNWYGQFHHELQCHPAFESFIIPTLAGFCLSIWTPSMELPSVHTYVRTCFSGLSIPFLTRRLLQFAPFKRFEEENSRFVGTCRRANISFKPSPFSNLKINLMIFHAGGYHRKDHQMKCFLCVPFCVFPPLKFKGSIISKDITGQQSSLQPGGGESHCWAQIRARWQASGRFRRGLLTGWMVEGFCMTWCFIQLGGCRVAVGDLPENHPLLFWFVGSQYESKCSGLKTPEKWDEQFFVTSALLKTWRHG